MKMCDPSQQTFWPETASPSMLSLGASLAKTSRSLARARALQARNPAYSSSFFALLAKFDPGTSSWKTSQHCFVEGFATFSEDWPRAGIMRNGIVYQRHSLARRITGTGYGLLPTPSGTSNHGQNHVSGRLDEWGGSSNPFRGSEIGKLHCPRFEEWMMGFPDRWTELTG